MLMLILAVLAGILLVHLLDSAIKAVVLVGCVLGIMWLGRGVTFEALTDSAARALYDATDGTAHVVKQRPPRWVGRGERI